MKPIILSLGGSIVSTPQGIDVEYLKAFNLFIREHIKRGEKFFVVVGGGTLCRQYRDAGLETIGEVTDTDLDWLGVHATRLNAHLLRTIFKDIAHPRIIENYSRKLSDHPEPLVIGAGWKPGWSTDYDAVILARDYGGELIINLSNIDYAYDKDPKKYADAKRIESINWQDFQEIVGTTWTPGANVPFDPIASKLAHRLNLKVVICNGKNLENVSNIINEKPFAGTVISNTLSPV